MKSGFVPVVGRPNVGKSTLVNRLVGSKVTITSARPQTTRNTIRGVVSGPIADEPEYQIVLIDTPGLHRPRNELGTRLNSLVYGTLNEADVVLFLIDATMPVGPGDRRIAARLAEADADVVLVVNKVDVAKRSEVVEQLTESGAWDFASYFPISARDGLGVPELLDELVARMPDGPAYYPPGMVTDQPETLIIGEIVREKFLDRLREELPHSLVVVVEEVEQREDGLIDITADVIVERDSQKGIVIGKGGKMLETAGSEARRDLEAVLGDRVNLRLHVKVEPRWQQKPQLLDRLGFE